MILILFIIFLIHIYQSCKLLHVVKMVRTEYKMKSQLISKENSLILRFSVSLSLSGSVSF